MRTITLITLLLFTILTFFSLSLAQNRDHNAINNKINQTSIVSIGETVSDMDKGLMIIFQDKKNNYWFGGEGVYKYDGKIITHFTIKDGLCSNEILEIQEDKNGNIFFDTPEGVSKFDGQQFTTLKVFNSNSSKNEWKLDSDDLWFRLGWNRNGPYRYDGKFLYFLEFPKTKQADEFYSINPNASYNPYGIYSMYKDNNGAVWFGTASLGVCRYDGKSVSWLYEKHLTEIPNGGSFGIRSIIEDKDGLFWFCNTKYRYDIYLENSIKKEINSINYSRKKGTGVSMDGNENYYPYFMSVVKDNNNDLWMATYDEGVWRHDGENLIHYPVKEEKEIVNIFSIYKDNQGVLWLGTLNAGAYKFNGTTFEKFIP
ncbi:MAG: hypothetical protein DWP97_07060 [Calditrichaeota bacterium]|nr:MAG: hypothetical protein DWP97_07060 [Calditrichota bacterium]